MTFQRKIDESQTVEINEGGLFKMYEAEMESLEKDFKSVEANYTENMMNLTLVRTYIKNLLKNAKVVRFLSTNYAELLSAFEDIAAAETM